MSFIRRARHTDSLAIIDVHSRAILEVCSKDYVPEQVIPWSRYSSKESIWIDRMDRDYLWVLELDGRVRGFAHLAIMTEVLGEVMGLYLHPEVVGKGYGKKLLEVVLQKAQEHELRLLTLLSTRTAKSFYEHHGFKQIEGDEVVEINGAQINCHPMISELRLINP